MLPLSFLNGPQALYVNPGYLKCISGINLFSADKKLFTVYDNIVF